MIKYSEELTQHMSPPPKSTTNDNDKIAFNVKIWQYRNLIHSEMIKDNDPKTLQIIMFWVKDWTEIFKSDDEQHGLVQVFPFGQLGGTSELIHINSIKSYTERTAKEWYPPTDLEISLVPRVFKFNILVWDTQLRTYTKYIHSSATKYCILMKTEHVYKVCHWTDKKKRFYCLFDLEELSPTIKCIFSLNQRPTENFEYYQLHGV
jgi:hypothetical protein